MPTYQYACTGCGDQLEVVQRFSDDPLTLCGACGGKLRKVYSPVGIVFKGSGFYRTDSRSGSLSGAANGNGKSGGEGSAGSESGSGGKAESGAKSESGTKTESGAKTESGSKSDSKGSSSSDKQSSAAGSSGTGSKVA